MKILIYGINYAPERPASAKYSAEMAEWLAARGHSVSVVTAPPYYHNGGCMTAIAPDAMRAGARRRLGAPRRCGCRRGPVASAPAPGQLRPVQPSQPAARRRRAADVILVVEPALFCAPAAWLAARLCGARAWLHVQDYEVDAAFELGLLKGAWLRRAVARAERWLMRRFDRVSTISERMLALARDRAWSPPAPCCCRTGSTRRRSRRTWTAARTARNSASPPTRSWRCIPATWAASRGLQVLADVARRLEGETRLWFVFCGQGPERAALQARCAGLARARFLDLQPAERLGELLCMADIHLLPQRSGAADLVMPSKLTGMLASGRPVVCGAAPGTELAGVITRCGLLTPLKTRRPWPRPCSAWRKTARPGPRWAEAARRHALAHLHVDAVLGAAERELAALPSRAGHRPRAPATPDGVRPITPKVRAASAAGPRR